VKKPKEKPVRLIPEFEKEPIDLGFEFFYATIAIFTVGSLIFALIITYGSSK
jgi:hypothetical protein